MRLLISLFVFLQIFGLNVFDSSTLKMGDVKAYVSGNNIMVDNFHGPSYGIAGIGSVSWGDFSFDKLDEFIYKQARKSNQTVLWVVLRYAEEDMYGNKSLGSPITIGKIDVTETKKYVDYSKWHLWNKTYDMWAKDKRAYDEENNRRMRNSSSTAVYIVPAYKPKSSR